MTFQHLLTKYRTISFSERDKGDRFERLMQAYLKTDPKYAFKFKNVWMWNEFPGKLDWEVVIRVFIVMHQEYPKNTLRPHQKEALDKTHGYFKLYDRGKLIMACGTGKTFNSLRIAENETRAPALPIPTQFW